MKPLSAILDHFEGDQAILKIDDQELRVHKDHVVGFSKNDVVTIHLMSDTEGKKHRTNVLKQILNEVITKDNQNNS